MGGSQLTALKSTLRSSGLSRTSNPKDPKKRSKQRKDLSATSLAHRNSKLDDIGKGFNQFDQRQEKRKFDVVTRGGKLEEGRKGAPTKSRTAGVELRKKTLLPMLQNRTHTSTFVDRRFGEASSTLTPEEKALERFTAERQSRLGPAKKGRFNLEDGDDGEGADEEEGLTHGGQKLGFGDEDELEHGGWGGLGAAVAGGASEGNREPLLRRRMAEVKGEQEEEDEQPERKRTKAEIMEEVMLKAKSHKYERQKMRSEDDETRHALDAELKDLRTLLGGTGRMPRPAVAGAAAGSAAAAAVSDDEEEEDDEDEDEDEDGDEDDSDGDSDAESHYSLNEEELEAALAASSKTGGVDRELLRKLIGSPSRSPSPPPPQSTGPAPTYELEDAPRPAPAVVAEREADPYDQYVRLLALEPRAKPSDRMKTPLELAQEAAEELRTREEKRLKRQRGEVGSDSEDGDEGESKGKRSKRKEKRAPQGDDLEDDYFGEEISEGEEEEGLGKGLEGGFGAQVIEDHSSEEGSEDEEESGDEDEEDSDEDLAAGLDDSDSDDSPLDGTGHEALVQPPEADAKDAKSRTWGGKDVKPELPFTFPCPTTHAEFVNLLRTSGIPEAETATVVKRIRVLYHPGLGESNKEKLQVFHNVLLDHILHLSSHPTSTTYTTINSLLPHLLTLSHAYPLQIAPYYLTKLSTMHANLLRGLSSADSTTSAWPSAPELTLLRLVGIVWSTSDLSHPVAAAALLLIAQYLAQARVRSLADLSSGLFLCSLVAQYEEKSRRVVPEQLNFLLNALVLLLPSTGAAFKSAKELPGTFPAPELGAEYLKALKLKGSGESLEGLVPAERVNFLEALQGAKGQTKAQSTQLKVDLIKVTLELVLEQAERLVSNEAFVEMFKPAEIILGKVLQKNLPTATKTHLATLLVSLRRMLSLSLSTRAPLTLQSHKPIPIATYIPKFDEGYNPTRRFDPDTERAEQSKLKSLYKKEKKGAIRELRKDNRFLAGEEKKRKEESDKVYEKKIAKIMGGLQDERAEEKAHERAKVKGKKQDKARAARK